MWTPIKFIKLSYTGIIIDTTKAKRLSGGLLQLYMQITSVMQLYVILSICYWAPHTGSDVITKCYTCRNISYTMSDGISSQ